MNPVERVPLPFIWSSYQLSCLYQLPGWDATQQQQEEEGKTLGSSALWWRTVEPLLTKLWRSEVTKLGRVFKVCD